MRKNIRWCSAWWCTPDIPALGEERQKDPKFIVILSYIVRSG